MTTTDLAAQIRATLDAWAKPTGFIEAPEVLTEAEYADLKRRFLEAQKEGPHGIRLVPASPFDRMRAALLEVLELHTEDSEQSGNWEHGPHYPCVICDDGPWPCPTLRAVAKALGIDEEA